MFVVEDFFVLNKQGSIKLIYKAFYSLVYRVENVLLNTSAKLKKKTANQLSESKFVIFLLVSYQPM